MDNALVMRAEIHEKQRNQKPQFAPIIGCWSALNQVFCVITYIGRSLNYQKREEHERVKEHCLAILTDFPDSRLVNSARELYRKLLNIRLWAISMQ